MIAFRKADSFEPGTNFGAWVREIARRKMLEHKRALSRTSLPLDADLLEKLEAAHSETDHSWEQEKNALRKCMGQLPERSRKLINLRYTQSLRLTRIAKAMKVSADAARMALNRILKKLMECISKHAARGQTR